MRVLEKHVPHVGAPLPEVFLPRRRMRRGEEATNEPLEHEVEQLALRTEVHIERHRRPAKLPSKSTNGEPIQADPIDKRKGGVDYDAPAQRTA